MHISILIVVANLKHRIGTTCEILDHGLKNLNFDYEILFFDNASRDGTKALLEDIASRRGHIKVFSGAKRCGFGAGLRSLLEKAQGDIVVCCEASLPIKLDALPFLVEKMNDADVIIASRFKDRMTATSVQETFLFRIYRLICQVCLKIPFRDLHPGLVMMYREVFPALELRSQSKNIFPEIFTRSRRKNFSVQEFPVEKRLLAPNPPLQQSCSLADIVNLFELKD